MSILTILLLSCLLILIVLSGFLSGSETALTATSKARILLKFKKQQTGNAQEKQGQTTNIQKHMGGPALHILN